MIIRFAAAVSVALVLPVAAQVRAADAALAPYEIVTSNGFATVPAPLTAVPGDPGQGEKVVTERGLGNCLACHEIGALPKEPFQGEIGPSLDGVAARWDRAALRMIIINPKRLFGDETVMPAFYRIDGLNRVRPEFAGRPILTAQQVEDVVAYLSTLK